MKATILDTLTGENITTDNSVRSYDWAENGYSCDCNRGLKFPYYENLVEGVCDGSKRFLVVAAEFGEGDYDYTLGELNECYPEELLRQHGIERRRIKRRWFSRMWKQCGEFDHSPSVPRNNGVW